jgi:hypothetical protein
VDAEVAEPVTDGPRDEHDVFRAGGEGLVANQELQFAGQQLGDLVLAGVAVRDRAVLSARGVCA